MGVTVADIMAWEKDRPITMLTAYDAPTASIVDEAGIDIILVGDSVGNAVLGYETTLPVTIEEIQSHTAAVARSTEEALVVADMPFLSYGVDTGDSIEHCGRMLKEADASAVKLESGPHTIELTESLVNLGIPVMAHLGLTPQHVNQLGGFGRQGTETEAAERIIELAEAHEEAGAFSLILEHVPSNLAERITETLSIPTVGIGAGPQCDGQVLVITDIIGLADWSPPFSKQYGDVKGEITASVEAFRDDVTEGRFPGEEHTYEQSDLFD